MITTPKENRYCIFNEATNSFFMGYYEYGFAEDAPRTTEPLWSRDTMRTYSTVPGDVYQKLMDMGYNVKVMRLKCQDSGLTTENSQESASQEPSS